MSNALLFVSKSLCCFNESKFSKLVLHFERLTISFLVLLIECLRVWYIRWCGGSLMSSKNDGNIGDGSEGTWQRKLGTKVIQRGKGRGIEIENEEIGESVVGHRANTSGDCRFCVATSPAPAEILTFPKIRNLPEGHGLILSTCHVRCPSWRLIATIAER